MTFGVNDVFVIPPLTTDGRLSAVSLAFKEKSHESNAFLRSKLRKLRDASLGV
jgi:hypothetical protein